MNLTRRDFGKMALATAPGLAVAGSFGSGLKAMAQAPKPNSIINGVKIGLQPFCYHDLPMNAENRPILFQRMVQNGLSIVELHATWVEPRFTGAGINPQEAREKLIAWRKSEGPATYAAVKKEADDYGITIFTVYVGFNENTSDEEIEGAYAMTKALGAQGAVGSYGQAVSKKLVPFPHKYGIFAGLHNHDNLSDPDAYSNEESFIKGLALSPDFKATLDVRHFTAGNGDCVGFVKKHHERMSSVHLGDRRRNNGRSAPFGQGDAPIIEVLRLIRDNQWPIVALLEFEHGTLRTGVEEVQIQYDYCKRALA